MSNKAKRWLREAARANIIEDQSRDRDYFFCSSEADLQILAIHC